MCPIITPLQKFPLRPEERKERLDGLVDRGDHQLDHGRASQGLHTGGEDISDVEETADNRQGQGLYTNTLQSDSFIEIFLGLLIAQS